MPLPENPFFTGREEVLEELKKTLDERGIAALTGLGGMGKTQTAAQYAHHHRKDYQAVLWVRAESQETLFSDLSQLAGRLELPEREAKEQSVIVEAVKLWLEEHEGWLLVLDNVEEFAVVRDLARKASANGHHVVITTQSQALGQIGRQRLSPMDRDLGAVLLLRRAIGWPRTLLCQASIRRMLRWRERFRRKLAGCRWRWTRLGHTLRRPAADWKII